MKGIALSEDSKAVCQNKVQFWALNWTEIKLQKLSLLSSKGSLNLGLDFDQRLYCSFRRRVGAVRPVKVHEGTT